MRITWKPTFQSSSLSFWNVITPWGVIADVEFHVSGYTLKPLPCVKFLGVQIDERLSFDEHVSSNALRRISKYLTLENRMSIYNALLTSNFSYCNMVWHFCSNRSMYKFEKVQQQALRVVLNEYTSPYRVLLDTVSKPTLYVSRLKSIAIEAYKCYDNEIPVYINVMLDPLNKPYDLRSAVLVLGSRKWTLCPVIWIPLLIRLQNCGIYYYRTARKLIPYSSSNHFYQNGTDRNAIVTVVIYAILTMFKWCHIDSSLF